MLENLIISFQVLKALETFDYPAFQKPETLIEMKKSIIVENVFFFKF